MSRAAALLAALVALYLVWAGALYLFQRRLVFPRHLLNPVTSDTPVPAGAEEVVLPVEGGEGRAWYLPPAREGDDPVPAVIFAHGNAELARDWVGAYRSVARRGVAVLLVEYPGYGAAPGRPSKRSITEVMVSAWDHLADRPEVDQTRIVGIGRSLGGGAVCALATERPLAGLVLQSTFTRARHFARRYLLPGILVRDPFDNLAVVERFDGPVLVLHGERDGVIPAEHGRRLAAAARRGRLVTWECGHNDCPPEWGEYLERVGDFVERVPPAAR